MAVHFEDAMQQEVSLYLDLHKDRKVDLVAAARAALAFDAALKEIAFAIDPFATIKVELESGTEGSLSLNSVITAVRLDPVKLKAIAFGIATFFALETATYTYSRILDSLLDEPDIQRTLSRQEIEEIAREVVRTIESKAAEREVGKIYQELQRDDAVKGVGISTNHNRKPREIIPRAEFQKRGRIVQESEKTGVRTESSVQTLTLISPVLVQASTRKWKFRSGKFEFGAPIKDQAFLDRVLSGREPVPMADGITMKVVMSVTEERQDGVWKIKERVIDEVLDISHPPEQTSLSFGPANEQQDENE